MRIADAAPPLPTDSDTAALDEAGARTLPWMGARVRAGFRAWRRALQWAFWAAVYCALWLARPCVRLIARASDCVWIRWPWRGTRRRVLAALHAAMRCAAPRAAEHYLSTLWRPSRRVGAQLAANPREDVLPLHSVSLNGCAWMLPFHIGVCSVLRAEGVVDSSTRWLGSSGGALIATAAALDIDLDGQLRACVRMGTHSSSTRALGPFAYMSAYIGPHVWRSLPVDAAERLRNRLYISVTEAPAADGAMAGNALLSDFSTRRELYHALMASTYIPLYYETPARPARRLRAFRFDGGFSNNQPVLHDSCGRVLTTTVSPTPMAADISPAKMAFPNIEHLFPKGADSAMAVYDSGVAVARRYVKKLKDVQASINAERKRQRTRTKNEQKVSA